MAASKPTTLRVRLNVTARAVAGILGGYVVTALAASLAARHLPLAPSEAVTTTILASFLIYAVIVLSVFAAKSTLKVWLWIGGAIVALGLGLWWSILTGGRL